MAGCLRGPSRGGAFLLLVVAAAAVMSSLAYYETWKYDDGEPGDLTFTLLPHEVTMEKGQSHTFNLTVSGDLWQCVNVSFELSGAAVGETPPPLQVCHAPSSYDIILNTTGYGYATLLVNTDPPMNLGNDGFSLLYVMKDSAITTTADVLGWFYTIAWDVSFLPQIVLNWRRKSVTGLSFDYIAFNCVGFTCYFIFNMGMLWIPAIQDEYYQRHPESVLHVRLNDVIFPLYALICMTFQVGQCFIYKRDPGQRVSTPCIVINSFLVLSAVVVLILVPTVDKVMWIDLLYWLSYIKLAITCIKYAPQVYINYKQKSTEAWSIGAVFLDFTGGFFSLIQMFLLASNYDDWKSVLTDPTKLGLGLLSIFFNILFFIQHYCLYRGNAAKENEEILKMEEEEKKGIDNQATTFM